MMKLQGLGYFWERSVGGLEEERRMSIGGPLSFDGICVCFRSGSFILWLGIRGIGYMPRGMV